MTNKKCDLPLVYSCSGCSNVAQLANDIAIVLDREGHAQMSCIAGVGGNVKGLVKLAKSGRPILAIDGCKVSCVKKVLELHQVKPKWHFELSSLGLKKIEHQGFSIGDMHKALRAAHQLLSIKKWISLLIFCNRSHQQTILFNTNSLKINNQVHTAGFTTTPKVVIVHPFTAITSPNQSR